MRCNAMVCHERVGGGRFVFPLQEASVEYVASALLQAVVARPNTRVVVCTYGIGKERILAAVAACLQCKIHVTPHKLEVLRCMDLPYVDIFTSDPRETNVHVKDMDFCRVDGLPYYRSIVTNNHMYTHGAKVWDSSVVQGPFSVASCQALTCVS